MSGITRHYMFAVACITYMLRFFDAFTLFYMRCVEVHISEIKIIFKNIFYFMLDVW